MRYLLAVFACCLLVACGEEEYEGECVYFSNIHSSYDSQACLDEGADQSCASVAVEDRSTDDETVFACVYSGCLLDGDRPDFDCERFRAL